MRIWRIVKQDYADRAFSGEGARRAGGRWNPRNTAMAYAAEHLSLAALELFVHAVEEDEPDDLISVEAELPLTDREVLLQQRHIRQALSDDWREDIEMTRRLGMDFLQAGDSVAMLVPSAIIDVEWNVLLNPAHPQIDQLKVVSVKPFRFDQRMFRRSSEIASR